MTTKAEKIADALKGNSNAQVRGQFSALLRRKTMQDPTSLDQVAEKLLEEAKEGNMQAINILFDRLDGKPHQAIEIGGEDGGNIKVELVNHALERLSKTIEKVRQSS